jgi:hypothetical protein
LRTFIKVAALSRSYRGSYCPDANLLVSVSKIAFGCLWLFRRRIVPHRVPPTGWFAAAANQQHSETPFPREERGLVNDPEPFSRETQEGPLL